MIGLLWEFFIDCHVRISVKWQFSFSLLITEMTMQFSIDVCNLIMQLKKAVFKIHFNMQFILIFIFKIVKLKLNFSY